MKDFKLSNRELCLIILLIFFGFIGIFSLYQLKNNESIEQSIDNLNTSIASRYVNIVKEQEYDVLNFLSENLSNEFVVVPAMDYIFGECFPRFSDEGKAVLYYYYYDNARRFQILYQDLIDVDENRFYLNNFLLEFENEEVDINDYNIYSQIELTSLKTLIHELRQSHFKLYPNNEYFEIYYDYTWFYSENESILPEEFVSFINLDSLSMDPSISPNREAIDIYGVENLVLASKDYLDTYADKNVNLRGGALQLFRSSLKFWLAGDNDSVYLFSDDEKYIISDEAYSYYDEFINKHPDSSLSILIEEVVKVLKEKQGEGYYLTPYVSPVIDNYLIENGYATEEEIAAFQESEGLNSVQENENISNTQYNEDLEELLEEYGAEKID